MRLLLEAQDGDANMQGDGGIGKSPKSGRDATWRLLHASSNLFFSTVSQ
jgi:hypothetical protein